MRATRRAAGIAAVAVVGAVLSPMSGSASSATASATPATVRTVAAVQATAGNYGAWAWSQGDMPQSIVSGVGGTLAQAEAAAVQACEAAGGGSGGFGGCYARDWFENAYSSFAYDASGGYWGVSDASSSADADSIALSYCSTNGATDCGIVGRAAASPTTSPGGAVLPAAPSYGVWAISPSAHIAAFGVGDTIQSAQQAAAINCEEDGGLAAECEVYGGWALNGYSAIYMGANGTWSISDALTPVRASYLAQHECQTVKAVGLACTLAGSDYTVDPWVGRSVGWIDQPTTLPSQSSPSFVCVTGPRSTCLQPGAGVPQKASWGPVPPGWLTSPITGGCVLELIPGLDVLDLLEDIGNAVQLDESNGLWIVRLAGTLVDNCTELAGYVLARKPVPQSLDSHGADLPQSGDVLDSAAGVRAQSLFQPLPKSQLASLKRLPFLSQRFGYAVAQVGSAAALSQRYPAAWSTGMNKSVVCRLQHGGYRCGWRFQLNGASHSGYVLIAATASSYRLVKVVQLPNVVQRSTTLDPLWYVLIGAAAVAVVIVIAMLARRRRTAGRAS
jgi:hypothetical protein